jgi:fatty-acid desaturase
MRWRSGCSLVAQHRIHHRHSDREKDAHSPWQRDFWWAHAGWVLSNEHDDYDPKSVTDFAKYPELVWPEKYHSEALPGAGLKWIAVIGSGIARRLFSVV